jgi:hypothetical protein
MVTVSSLLSCEILPDSVSEEEIKPRKTQIDYLSWLLKI